ncbi:terminase small subunit [Marinobacter sp. UBA2688]|uniref:terminase small subunit n=1 Tax=Marinobacter sp. UBA2688 TaxID=1946816 RepID=UPI00257D518A|nr:terminase small subunit [Marinobacter sp. UBA2688]|tara:strand:- start:4912 stop:5409 length:498 start_codon:yes stop_codon:yes gene_type:complete
MIEKPYSHWLTQQQMAKSLGITVSAFSRWEVEPVARIGKHVYYDVRSVIDNRLEKADQSGSNSDIEAERLRLTRAQAEGQEIKNELARGKTAPVEIIALVLSKIAGEASGILDSLPLDIRRRHPELQTAVIESIKRQVVKAQNAIARTDETLEHALEDYMEQLDQ